jgi:hypothetical protein
MGSPFSCQPRDRRVVGYVSYDGLMTPSTAFDLSDARVIRAADAVSSTFVGSKPRSNSDQHALDLGATGIIAPDVTT